MSRWFDADQLEAHSQKDIVDGEQFHLEKKSFEIIIFDRCVKMLTF